MNDFKWANDLMCPPNSHTCNSLVKKKLSKGIMGVVWDKFGTITFPRQEALKIRKNIILHKLRHKKPDLVLNRVNEISQMKSEAIELEAQISELEKEYESKDYKVRKKKQQLNEIEASYSKMKEKKYILKAKYDQTKSQIQDCILMRHVCKTLMPYENNVVNELNEKYFKDCIKSIIELRLGTDKREVVHKVVNLLGDVNIKLLWDSLYEDQKQNIQKLTDTTAAIDDVELLYGDIIEGEDIDVGISKMCNVYLRSVVEKISSITKTEKHEKDVVNLINEIEKNSRDNENLPEWLALTLENHKLDKKQKSLLDRIEYLSEICKIEPQIQYDYTHLMSEINFIDHNIELCVRNIKQSLVLVKSAPALIKIMNEKLQIPLEKLFSLRSKLTDYENSYQDCNSTNELDIFYNDFDLSALRKIALRGKINTVRHIEFCVSDIVTPNSFDNAIVIPYYPFICIPALFLIKCFKILTLNSLLEKFEYDVKPNELPQSLEYKVQMEEHNIMSALQSAETSCINSKQEMTKYFVAKKNWEEQTVRQAMDLLSLTIDGTSYEDWMKRYQALCWMVDHVTS